MTFVSTSFVVCAAALLLLYYLLPGRFQWGLLLIASFGFYALADLRYLGFLVFTIVTTYAGGRLMEGKSKQQNKPWLITWIVLNFAMLFFCKGMLLAPLQRALSGTGLSFLSLGLPLGLSFFIFQAAGYMLDVYRGTIGPEKNFFKLALLLAYFPQLVQGPISRYNQLEPQLFGKHPFCGRTVYSGLLRVLWGYFKKLVIADRIAPAVMALRDPELGGMGFFLLTLFYSIQIYGDFTGGIDITLGLSEALGITLPENFKHPFRSKNIAEYWRRWHITLGTWMKDYIFFPLSISAPMRKLSKAARKRSKNFGKRLPVYVASIVTWCFTGIWHGLTFNFVLWGLLNCLVIVVSEELNGTYEKFHGRFGLNKKPWYDNFQMVRTFLLMNLIRACDLFPQVGGYFAGLGSMVTNPNVAMLWNGGLGKLGLSGLDYGILAAGIALITVVGKLQLRHESVRQWLSQKPVWVQDSLVLLLVLVVILMGCYGMGYNASTFIYNQF